MLEIKQLWPTSVLQGQLGLPDEVNAALLKMAVRTFEQHQNEPAHNTAPIVGDQKFRAQHNLFGRELPSDEASALNLFRQAVDSAYRQYLKATCGVENVDEIRIVSRCIPGVLRPGERTMPHYHHTCDHVACYYLDCGTDRPQSGGYVKQGDGELLLQDPRHMGSFPFWEKLHWVKTDPGLFILHPAQVWHETNAFMASGQRVMLAVTLRVASHNYTDLYVDL
jgi:hypothetical protein